MSSPHIQTRTRDGHMFVSSTNTISTGLPTAAIVPSTPSSSLLSSYDVIVIGAGFAGLVAARDLAQRNPDIDILVLEARDRIGGRTWTAKAWGEEFEMGGGWVHWTQPHVYAEASKQNMHSALQTSNIAVSDIAFKARGCETTHPIAGDMASYLTRMNGLVEELFTLDGMSARELMPFPHDPFRQPRQPWWEYDHMSMQDRLDQMSSWSAETKEQVEGATNYGNNVAAEVSFTEGLRWYALSGYSMQAVTEAGGMFKFGDGGMTEFARRILGEYNGDRALNAVVRKVRQTDDGAVEVSYGTKQTAKAKYVICTIPLNCLSDLVFDPPLDDAHRKAVSVPHPDTGAKIFYGFDRTENGWGVNTADREMSDLHAVSCDHNAIAIPATYAIGFGFSGRLNDPANSEEILIALRKLKPEAEVRGYLTHGWAKDPFARGAWYYAQPAMTSRYLWELQQPHGRIIFASADWADGWRGFVDGAIEQGARAAQEVSRLLQRESCVGEQLRARLP